MVASGKSTIYNDQRAMPESSAGTKARDETFTYDEATYEKADEMDGTSSRSRAVPNEAHSEQHIRAPGVGQNAQKCGHKCKTLRDLSRQLMRRDTGVSSISALCDPARTSPTMLQKMPTRARRSTARSVRFSQSCRE